MTQRPDNIVTFARDPKRRRQPQTTEERPTAGAGAWWTPTLLAAVLIAVVWIAGDFLTGWFDALRSANTETPAPSVVSDVAAETSAAKAIGEVLPPVPAAPAGDGKEAVQAQSRAADETLIYRCVDASGHSTYTDRPCEGVVELRRYDAASVNTYSPEPGGD